MKFFSYNLTLPILKQIFNENYYNFRYFSSKKTYKVLYFGSDVIALRCLHKINELRKTDQLISCLNVVTANPKYASVVDNYAQSENIKTLVWPLTNLKQAEYDIGLIVAFGHLITEDVLKKFPLGMVNVHPSLLPRWRGAAPIIHTLMHGDQVTGVSLMKIKPDKFDVGEIISQRQINISKDIKLPELTDKLTDISAEMLAQCMRNLPDSLENAIPQSPHGVTYAKKINKNISDVRWSEMDSIQVYNLYRALYGLYNLSSTLLGQKVKLFDAFLQNESCIDENKPIGHLDYCERLKSIKILCKDKKYIYFKHIRIVGKKKITALDFYNGYIKNMPQEKRSYVLGN